MDPNPYANSVTEEVIDIDTSKDGGKWIARLGVALFTGPIWGLLGTVIGMIRAFSTLGENSDDSATALAHDISVAMYTTMIGLGLGLVGAILILVALLSSKNRQPWFFSWSVSLSVFWSLVVFPYGVIVGGPIAFLFFRRRSQFERRRKA
jgi:hypothetical protein